MADGDKRAFKMLTRHHVRIFRFVMRLVGNEPTADEVVNEVFLAAAVRWLQEISGCACWGSHASDDHGIQATLGGETG